VPKNPRGAAGQAEKSNSLPFFAFVCFSLTLYALGHLQLCIFVFQRDVVKNNDHQKMERKSFLKMLSN
jgi:hypothetical protein